MLGYKYVFGFMILFLFNNCKNKNADNNFNQVITNLDSVFTKIDSSGILKKKLEIERDSFLISIKDSSLINSKVKFNKYIGHGEELGLLENKEIKTYFKRLDVGFFEIDTLKTKELKVSYKNNDTVIFDNNTLFIVKDSKFRKFNHKYDVYYQGNYTNRLFVNKIDGDYFWGTDGDLPYRQADTIILSINKSKNLLPKSTYFNLYSPNINYSSLHQSFDKKYLFLWMENSDGAGSYEVYFVFKDNIFIGRIVLLGEC